MAGNTATDEEGSSQLLRPLFAWHAGPMIGWTCWLEFVRRWRRRRISRIRSFPAATSKSTLPSSPPSRAGGCFAARLVALSIPALVARPLFFAVNLTYSSHYPANTTRTTIIPSAIATDTSASLPAAEYQQQSIVPFPTAFTTVQGSGNIVPVKTICPRLPSIVEASLSPTAGHPSLESKTPVTQQTGIPVEKLTKPDIRPSATALAESLGFVCSFRHSRYRLTG